MSKLSPQQFEKQSGQLPMFMQTSRVIEEVHKIDHPRVDYAMTYGGRIPVSPGDQWRKPGPQGDILRDEVSGREDLHRTIQEGKVEPIAIHRDPLLGDLLADGHHRLRAHEALGVTEIPVVHRQRPRWGYLGPSQ